MDNNNIFKIWGTRKRILLTKTDEIDLLHLKKNCFCSTHNHKHKINLFYVLKGKVKIETEFGSVILVKGQSFEVRPPLKHRFMALTKSEMIELAYVEKGKIDSNDINRISQGGKIIDRKELTLNQMREQGLLEL